jgi:glucosyl-dolichyl phosphate glucuronosyltransferase
MTYHAVVAQRLTERTPDGSSARRERPSVSVVICTYASERLDEMVAAVESVTGQAIANDEVIVVVDHNPTLAHDLRRRLRRCTVIENSEPKGLSGARNAGVRTASGDIVLFLDDDAVACDGWIDAHVRAFSSDSVVGTAGLVTPTWADGCPPAWWPELFDWVVGCNHQREAAPGAAVRNPVGANMGFRRQAIIDAGGFSHHLGRTSSEPLGCEETELAIRVVSRDQSTKVVWVGEAACEHRVPAARTTWRYFRRRCVAEGRSKAMVARLTGLGSATSEERSYTRTVLRSVAMDAVPRRRPRRALAALAGVAFAVFGFVPGLIGDTDATEGRSTLGPTEHNR